MQLLLTCKYCDHKWEISTYSDSVPEEKCSRCGDPNIRVTELSKSKIDAYEGCPPFVDRDEKDPNGGYYGF